MGRWSSLFALAMRCFERAISDPLVMPLLSLQMGMWSSLFVLATLLLNAPTVPLLLRLTRLAVISPFKLGIRDKARRALLR